MKKLFVLLLLTVSITAFSQNELSFSKVIKADSTLNKDNLFVSLKSFLSTYYKSSKSVIQMEDKESGIIIGKATSLFDTHSMFLSSYDGYIDYEIKLQSKDGRVKIELTHFYHHNIEGHAAASNLGVLTDKETYADSGLSKKYHNKVWAMLKKQAVEISNDLFDSFEKQLKTETTKNSNDNW